MHGAMPDWGRPAGRMPLETDGRREARVRDLGEQAASAVDRLRSAAARLTTNGIAQTSAIAEIARTARTSTDRVIAAGHTVSQARARTTDADEQLRSAGRGIEELTTATAALASATKTAIASIGELLALTQQIDGIVDFVREVSERTNLLALNASIEAARAGEHGRGFAVVAGEVRKLAASTREATRDMDALLRRISAGGAATSALGDSLDDAVGNSERSAEGAYAALSEISSAVSDVVATFAEVERLIESEVASAEEYGAAAGTLLHSVRDHFADTAETQQWIGNAEVQIHELLALEARKGTTTFAPVRTLRVGCATAPDSLPARMLQTFKHEVEELSSGDLRVELIVPYEKRPAQLLIDLRTGDLSLAAANCALIGTLVPQAQLLELPFLFRSRRHAFAMFDSAHARALLGAGTRVDLVFLGFSENGVRHYTNDVRELRVADDIRDLRMRTLDAPIQLYIASALDVTPYPMPIGQVKEALRQRRIDGQDNPLPTIVGARFHEDQRFLTLTAHTYTPQIIVANPETLAALGERRALVERAAERAIAWQREHAARVDAEALAELRRTVHVTDLTEAERETFVRATAPVYDRAAALVGEGELTAMRRAADDALRSSASAGWGWT